MSTADDSEEHEAAKVDWANSGKAFRSDELTSMRAPDLVAPLEDVGSFQKRQRLHARRQPH